MRTLETQKSTPWRCARRRRCTATRRSVVQLEYRLVMAALRSHSGCSISRGGGAGRGVRSGSFHPRQRRYHARCHLLFPERNRLLCKLGLRLGAFARSGRSRAAALRAAVGQPRASEDRPPPGGNLCSRLSGRRHLFRRFYFQQRAEHLAFSHGVAAAVYRRRSVFVAEAAGERRVDVQEVGAGCMTFYRLAAHRSCPLGNVAACKQACSFTVRGASGRYPTEKGPNNR